MTGNRRLAVTAAVVAALALPATHAPAVVVNRPGPCPLERQLDETVRHLMKRLIRCAADKWPVRGGAERAICIAERESHLNPRATSATGLYVGLFQHSASAWTPRFRTWTRPHWELNASALNGRSNAIVTIRMVHADGWGPWRGVGCRPHPA
jgi:hypothetical protein